MRELILDAASRAADFIEGNADGRAFPDETALAGLDELTTTLPDGSSSPSEVLDELDRLGSPAATRSTGGRYFGFVTGGTEPSALAASVLASAWDQNGALPAMSPLASRLDDIAVRWIVDLLGLPASASASFCGGASVANLTCIIAARDALLDRHGWSVADRGLAGSPPLRVIAGAEAHVSIDKALRNAGIGKAQVDVVPTDRTGAMVASAFPHIDDRPTLVLLQSGNVNTGHSDPFADLIPSARERGAWVHVDGAFGLWAAVSPSLSHLVAGVDQADSWATDAHKWLNVTYDCAVAVCRDPADLRRAMHASAAYLPDLPEARANMHLGMQMSQRARGVEVWAVLRALGRTGVTALIERSCRLASRFAEGLSEAGVDILAPVVLNQVLAAFGPAGPDGDAQTDRVIDAVQTDGTCWVGPTTWQGRRAMRISVSDRATTEGDIDRSVQTVLGARD